MPKIEREPEPPPPETPICDICSVDTVRCGTHFKCLNCGNTMETDPILTGEHSQPLELTGPLMLRKKFPRESKVLVKAGRGFLAGETVVHGPIEILTFVDRDQEAVPIYIPAHSRGYYVLVSELKSATEE